MIPKTAIDDGLQSHWTFVIADNMTQSLSVMAITRSVGFAVSVLVARRLGAENLGVNQQVAVLVTVLASVATWGMPVSIIPQLACSANDDERRSLIHASLLAAFGIATVLALFLVALSPYCVQLLLHHPLPGVLG